MNQAQAQVEKQLLQNEKETLEAIEKAYRNALTDIKRRIRELSADELTQSKIYQIEYQKAVQGQIETIIDNMQSKQYDSIQTYLKDSYTDAYIGTMYDLAKQGIPVIMPINQDQVVKAVTSDVKLSSDMYTAMGKYLKPLKKQVTQEISRGLASSQHWNVIGAAIERRSRIGLSNAQRIARTEGHRVQNASKMDAMNAAKDTGADIVKQWDSTLDKRTRPHHSQLDGQIREIDEPFEIAGRKAQYPGGFGRASEDINCRCTMLQRAKWALDDEELETLKERAAYFGLDKTDSFKAFKEKYLQASETINEIRNATINRSAQIYKTLETQHVDKIDELVNGADEIKKSVWLKYESQFKLLNGKYTRDGAHFTPLGNGVNMNVAKDFSENKRGSMVTWFHEFGHNMDYLADERNGRYYSSTYKNGLFGSTIREEVNNFINKRHKELREEWKKASDELNLDWFHSKGLAEYVKDKDGLKAWLVVGGSYKKRYTYEIIGNEVRSMTDAQKCDLSDILEGVTGAKIQAGWGHGKSYWKNTVEGFRDTVSVEAFAEMYSAYMGNPDGLEILKQYLPESVKIFDEMIAELAKE